jgi:RhtB (resistance to homoserine/threonine) family protein
MYLAQFITIAVVFFIAVLSPGPDFAIVTKNALVYNRKVGIYTAIGVALGIMVHVTYSMLGVALIISKSILLFNIIKYIGAAYLVYIGYKALQSKPSVISETEVLKVEEKELGVFASLRNGFLTNALNPKATLFFLALFTQVVSPLTPKYIELLYGIEMTIITGVWFSVVAILFSNKIMKARISKVKHHIERVTGIVLIALGIKVALASSK